MVGYKIITLVPAYKPKYISELVLSLRNQTVKPSKIIISDDSPDQSFISLFGSKEITEATKDLNIVVVKGPQKGGYNNFRFLMENYIQDFELFHIQLDDDIPYPRFYERHLEAHESGEYYCVVSKRWTANEDGQPIKDMNPPPYISTSSQMFIDVNSDLLFSTTVALSSNWIGEFSNATFRSEMASELIEAKMAGISYEGLEDLGGFLMASKRSPLKYINENLGFFRLSQNHNSADPMGKPMKKAHLAYLSLLYSGFYEGYITRTQLNKGLSVLCPIIKYRYHLEKDMSDICSIMDLLSIGDYGAEIRFKDLWDCYIRMS